MMSAARQLEGGTISSAAAKQHEAKVADRIGGVSDLFEKTTP
jgi:hypothetical protein